MTPAHSSEPVGTHPESARWSRATEAQAHDDFRQPARSSQRQYAQAQGIPRSTLGSWLRREEPTDLDQAEVAFFRSVAGEAFLRRLVLAALLTFQQQGACGLRLVSTFLRRADLDAWVGASRGALHALTTQLEADLAAFRDAEQPRLARAMQPQTITLIPDEHFHSGKPCLVAIEPVSNFIAVECYRERRDAATWTAAIVESTQGLPVEIIQLTSDLARGLLCCAEKGLQAAHSPDLFHGQRDLLQPLLLPLQRPIQQAEKDLEKAEQDSQKLDGPLAEPATWDEFVALVEAVKKEAGIQERLTQARQHKAAALTQVRGVGDDYHPFDRETGKPVTARAVGQRLQRHLDQLQEVVREAGLPEKASAAIARARTWVTTLMGCVAWFWGLTKERVAALELSEAQEQLVYEKLLPGYYWARAAGRARSAEERQRLQELAAQLQQEAWQEQGVLAALSADERQAVAAVAQASADLFQRASSCVEGRNGRLSLQHHGHSRISERRLQALTVIHNYLVQDADGTTPAERFFGQKHTDLFTWLLERMSELPRPAQRRPKAAA